MSTASGRNRVSYGPHLVGDLRGTNPELAVDGAFIYEFLNSLCSVIGLEPMGSPHLDWYTGEHDEWAGFSATLHIQTSHITLHAFEFGYLFIDIFSCKPFDQNTAIQFVQNMWQPDSARWQPVERGYDFPPELLDPAQAQT